MLERLGRHREALSVYVHDLGSMQLAEEYCDRVYEAGVAAAAAAGGAGAGAAASAAAAAAAAAGTALQAAPDGAAGAAGGFEVLPRPGGWGGSRPAAQGVGSGASAPAPAAAAGDRPRWGTVQRGSSKQQRQQRKQQQQQQALADGDSGSAGTGVRSARRRLEPGGVGQRSWSALPFGAAPQDIYMELVDAVLQVCVRVCVCVWCVCVVCVCVVCVVCVCVGGGGGWPGVAVTAGGCLQTGCM
jgi:hypothetical protein